MSLLCPKYEGVPTVIWKMLKGILRQIKYGRDIVALLGVYAEKGLAHQQRNHLWGGPDDVMVLEEGW